MIEDQITFINPFVEGPIGTIFSKKTALAKLVWNFSRFRSSFTLMYVSLSFSIWYSYSCFLIYNWIAIVRELITVVHLWISDKLMEKLQAMVQNLSSLQNAYHALINTSYVSSH